MKKSKKILSFLLCAILILAVAAPMTTAFASNECNPVVYIEGYGAWLKRNYGTAEEKTIFPINIEDGYIGDQAKGLIPVFAMAMLTDDWDEYCDYLYDAMAPLYTDLVLDDNGNPKDNSDVSWYWQPGRALDKRMNADGTYDIDAYTLHYDWRLDPMEIADKLNSYIYEVMKATGAKKVDLIGRCLGGNIVSAYIQKYGTENVDSVVYYCTVALGTAMAGAPFSGELIVDSDAVVRFLNDMNGESTLSQFVKSSVALFNQSSQGKLSGLDITAEFVNRIYQKVYQNLVPRLLHSTYATFPSYWSMVGDKYYEAAKNLQFGDNMADHAEFIAKIDNYHYNVQNKLPEILKQAEENGVKVYNISKYGYQFYPVADEAGMLTDGTVELTSASFGATCAPVDKTLSSSYISAAKENGTYSYISPSKEVDASTCLFPESTWIIKNITHANFPDSIDVLITECLRSDKKLTVNDDERFPQYMVYDDETGEINPMTDENSVTTDYSTDFIHVIFKFFTALINLLRDLCLGNEINFDISLNK